MEPTVTNTKPKLNLAILKKNWALLALILATALLATIAMVTIIKIINSKKTTSPTTNVNYPIKPPAPLEQVGATGDHYCTKSFDFGSGPTITPTGTPGPTSTPNPKTGCDKTCGSDSDCESGLSCLDISGNKRCRNPNCKDESDCACNKGCWQDCGVDTECPSGLSCRYIENLKRCVNPNCETESDCDCATPTSAPQLPSAGFTLPTWGGLVGGAALIIASLILLL